VSVIGRAVKPTVARAGALQQLDGAKKHCGDSEQREQEEELPQQIHLLPASGRLVYAVWAAAYGQSIRTCSLVAASGQ